MFAGGPIVVLNGLGIDSESFLCQHAWEKTDNISTKYKKYKMKIWGDSFCGNFVSIPPTS